ncbi:MAG: deoxyribonuclease IV [Actinobacteria bacterium]|nr:deoxyribonuclease IV [Actinomycetota bacterium]
MLLGAHVRSGPQLSSAIAHGEEIGAQVVQIFTQSPRAWKPSQYAPDALQHYREAQHASAYIQATFCHATYLVNLAGDDPELHARSIACLKDNLAVAAGIGSAGVVLHLGSHKGAGLKARLDQIALALIEVLDKVSGCRILIENAAGAGGTVGRSFDELEAVLERVQALGGQEDRIGICLDSQHLWASGVNFATPRGMADLMEEIANRVGISRLGCLHLNDSKVALGANRDRHANIGEGTIGEHGLAMLLGHPLLRDVPAVLEVPGAGKGPRAEDLAAAHSALVAGLDFWAQSSFGGGALQLP